MSDNPFEESDFEFHRSQRKAVEKQIDADAQYRHDRATVDSIMDEYQLDERLYEGVVRVYHRSGEATLRAALTSIYGTPEKIAAGERKKLIGGHPELELP